MKRCTKCSENFGGDTAYTYEFCPICGSKLTIAKKIIISYYLHQSKETNRGYAEEIGLSSDAKNIFLSTCYQVKLKLRVYSDGKAEALALNGVDLIYPVEV